MAVMLTGNLVKELWLEKDWYSRGNTRVWTSCIESLKKKRKSLKEIILLVKTQKNFVEKFPQKWEPTQCEK